jgi:hypothetical protein
MGRAGLALLALLPACGRTPLLDVGLADEGTPDGGVAIALPPECADAGAPPHSLVCTGLYADIAAKELAPGARPYAPAVPLWSDGAEKARWISLPPGQSIDASNRTEWVFPVGTKLFKEFSREGRRVETRLWQKVREGFWVHATYAWNDDETSATSSPGGDIHLPSGASYHIPTGDECEKCHRGRTEHILGFEEIELGLPGATGLTLAMLMAQGLLSSPPPSPTLTLGDDGTGAAAPALGWLHANCGITCHNRNSNATAFGSGQFLRLDPADLDGRSLSGADALRTTVNVAVNAPNWNGQIRIVPGDPDRSLLYHLISHRGEGDQMPPIATSLVDDADVALVGDWIRRMPHP